MLKSDVASMATNESAVTQTPETDNDYEGAGLNMSNSRPATLSEELTIEATLGMFTKRQPALMREAAKQVAELSTLKARLAAAGKELPPDPMHTNECSEQNIIPWQCICEFNERRRTYTNALRQSAVARIAALTQEVAAANKKADLNEQVSACLGRQYETCDKDRIYFRDELARVTQEVEKSRADAERYRWLQSKVKLSNLTDMRYDRILELPAMQQPSGCDFTRGSIVGHLDSMIDAALAKGGKKFLKAIEQARDGATSPD